MFVNGSGWPGSTVGLTFAPTSGGGPAMNFTIPVNANGTWFVRPLNIPAGTPSGSYQMRAVCVVNGTPSAPAIGDFLVQSSLLARSEAIARSSPRWRPYGLRSPRHGGT